MNNSLIMMTNTGVSSVLANGIIPLPNIQRRRGRVIQNGSDSITLNAPGYYKVNATITFTAPAAGDVVIELQKSGISVPGVIGSETITTATTEVAQITLSGVIRVTCGEGVASLTLVNTGVAITTSNVEIDVEYLG